MSGVRHRTPTTWFGRERNGSSGATGPRNPPFVLREPVDRFSTLSGRSADGSVIPEGSRSPSGAKAARRSWRSFLRLVQAHESGRPIEWVLPAVMGHRENSAIYMVWNSRSPYQLGEMGAWAGVQDKIAIPNSPLSPRLARAYHSHNGGATLATRLETFLRG